MTLTPGIRGLIVDIKIKPKNRFDRGLFAARTKGNRFEHGNHLIQGNLKGTDGRVLKSDDALGLRLQLVGIAVDPLASLSAAQRKTWQDLGGTSLTISARGTTSKNAWEDIDDTFGARNFPKGWIIAVRPDKVVITDGEPAQANAIVDTVAKLLR